MEQVEAAVNKFFTRVTDTRDIETYVGIMSYNHNLSFIPGPFS